MKHIHKIQPLNVNKNHNDLKEDYLSHIQKKEKMLSIGIYSLVIIITIALMLILINVVIKF
ncbi:MAG: hypothetical protein EHM47_18575 [Ignavibacteriales bacterium]|nr:MAG: hypothetical protein EHM47_18575 [Ignavibacteriales bacterium]